jgi:hypothetical protein
VDRFALDSGRPLDPERMKEAVALALRDSNPMRRHLLLAKLMESLTAANAPAALATIRGIAGGFESMRYMDMLAYAWGSVDPQAAMAQFGGEGGQGGRYNQGVALTAWAARSPEEATAWLEKLQDRDKAWFTGSMIEGLASRDPAAAFKYAQTLTSPDAKRAAGDALAQEMLKGGVDTAAAWLRGLTDPDMQRGAFGVVAEQYQRTDLAKAMEFVKPYANDPFAREQIGAIAEAVGREDVTKGLAFATSLKGSAQSKALGEVIGEWMERSGGKETLEASEYVSKLPPEIDRDHAAWAISHRMVKDDAPAAIAWAQSIKDPEVKQQALMDVAIRYQQAQPEEFAKWLPQSGLSVENQKNVTNSGWRQFAR